LRGRAGVDQALLWINPVRMRLSRKTGLGKGLVSDEDGYQMEGYTVERQDEINMENRESRGARKPTLEREGAEPRGEVDPFNGIQAK